MRVGLFAAIVFAAARTLASAADTAPSDNPVAAAWRGVSVLPKEGYTVKVGNEVIDSYDKPALRLPWVVQETQGQWLLVGGSRKGWVPRGEVVTMDEAPAYYTELVKKHPDDYWAYNLRGLAWRERHEYALAVADFDEVLRLHPNSTTYVNRGTLWQAIRDYSKAVDDYNQAIRLDPNNFLAFVARGTALCEEKEFGRAIADFEEALRIEPGYARAYERRGTAWFAKGKYAEAQADYRAAIRRDPAYASAFRETARLLATCPDASFRDGKQAIENAQRACQLTGWSSVACLDVLASAYAESGDFDAAVKYERQAITHTRNDGEFLAMAKEHLADFEQGKPVRQDSP